MMKKTDTDLEINPSERYIWAALNLLIVVSSLFGDTMILIGSIKYRAIRLHRITVAVIQHLAVINLVLTANRVLPITISLVTNRWIFGEVLCNLQQYVDKICYRTVYFLTCTLTTTKLMTIKFPLKCGVWSECKAQKLCFLMEGVSLCFVAPFILLYYTAGREAVSFSYLTYNCGIAADLLSSELPLKTSLHFLLNNLLPACIYLIPALSSGLILVEARRVAHNHQQHLRWEGVMTALLTCLVYYISFIPHTLTAIILSVNYFKVAEFLLNFNVMANFYIYTLTVQSFRTFIRTWCQSWVQWFGFRASLSRCVDSVDLELAVVRRRTHLELTRFRLVQ